MLSQEEFTKKLKNIKMLILDVDGVLTDRCIILDNNSNEYKVYNAYDGAGITMLIKLGIKVGIISGRFSECTTLRAKQLGIVDVYQGNINKVICLDDITKKNSLKNEDIAYIGDDLFDIPVLRKVGLAITVQDAIDEVKTEVDYICKHIGGDGAVREVTDLILKAQDLFGQFIVE